jgi:hypothetical protein
MLRMTARPHFPRKNLDFARLSERFKIYVHVLSRIGRLQARSFALQGNRLLAVSTYCIIGFVASGKGATRRWAMKVAATGTS